MNVGVVGLGKLGLPMAALFAARGHTVLGIDTNAQRVLDVNRRQDPVRETGLRDLLASLPPRALEATTDFGRIAETDVVFIVVPTPSNPDGAFSNRFILEAIHAMGPGLGDRWRTVVICSTVMPGSMGGVIAPELEDVTNCVVGRTIGLCYSPEFVALGSVLADMQAPDFILIGTRDVHSGTEVEQLLASVAPGSPRQWTSFINAEVAKIALNSYLTVKVSFANTLAEICERLPGGNAAEVARIVGTDHRIGHAYFRPGEPAGGPCLPRDLVAFARMARELDVRTALTDAALQVNDHQVNRVADRLYEYRRVAILGMAYKPGTPVTDESLGVRVGKLLVERGHEVVVHDPQAALNDTWDRSGTAQGAVDVVDAVLIALPLDEYRLLNYAGKYVVDVWGVAMSGDVFQIGKGST